MVSDLLGERVRVGSREGEVVSLHHTYGCPIEIGVAWDNGTYSVIPLHTAERLYALSTQLGW